MLVPRACLPHARWTAMLLYVFLRSIAAYPRNGATPNINRASFPSSISNPQDPNSTLSIRGDTFYLRILPLGASITWGTKSTDGNGYRKALRDQLRFDGWNVNMVGSRSNGTMNDRVCLTYYPSLLLQPFLLADESALGRRRLARLPR